MEVASNLSYVSVGAVLSVDDSFIHLLDAPSGAHFARDSHTNLFVSVDAGS